MAVRRRNAIAKRFAKMRGLPPEEKLLMQRIGNLLDSALNNRQASNPFENARKITTRDIYPPTGILVKKGIKSVKIVWDAPPSNLLLRYEVTFDNLTTGKRTVVSSFINEVIFKATKGSYVARIVSIGRDRSTSLVKTVQFSAGEDVMQLEGAKNGPLELGTLVQDDIRHLEGYSVYVWGSVVLDKYAVANNTNTTATFRLWKADGPNAVFTDPKNVPTLVETIEMYAATESASNLDNSARGGLITRPVGAGRTGSFETSQAVMFSPIAVVAADADETFTYFLQAINRPTDTDEVNLSLTMWTGADGQGDNVPGDPFTPDPAYVFPHKNCFHTQIVGWVDSGAGSLNPALDTRSMWAYIPQSLNLIANQHTVAMWFRPDSLNARDMSTARDAATIGSQHLLSRIAMKDNADNFEENSWDIRVNGLSDGSGGHLHELFVSYNSTNGKNDTVRQWRARIGVIGSGNEDVSADLFSFGGAPTATNAQNDAWYFLVICFEGGDFTGGGISKLRVYLNSATHPTGGAPAMLKIAPTLTDGFENPIVQDDTNTHGYSIGDLPTDISAFTRNVFDGQYTGNLRTPELNGDIQFHQLGIWNIALDRNTDAGSDNGLGGLEDVGLVDGFVKNSAIDYLFNKGFGTLVDWKKNSATTDSLGVPIYRQAGNLCHLIQFGAVEQAMSTGFPGRDTGYHLYKGDMNFTGVTPEGRYPPSQNYTGNPPNEPETADNTGEHWTDNTSIADILSPDGNNGTTKFDKCHPGQNL